VNAAPEHSLLHLVYIKTIMAMDNPTINTCTYNTRSTESTSANHLPEDISHHTHQIGVHLGYLKQPYASAEVLQFPQPLSNVQYVPEGFPHHPFQFGVPS
jgi:hypothetical protein